MQYPKKFKHLISHFSALPPSVPRWPSDLCSISSNKMRRNSWHSPRPSKISIISKAAPAVSTSLKPNSAKFAADENRDPSVICVVEEPLDVIAIERTGAFRGLYHVLGGVMDMSREQEGATLKISELVARVTLNGVSEVILATNPTTEGDVTALYIKKKLEGSGATVTRIARGLATGGDIEYADEASITASLTNRK
jgi:recombination protein RecR